jgi:hypothetical protein
LLPAQVFSFKLRGAFNKMASLSPEQLARGVITSSAGNHAQGLSLAAAKLVSDSLSLRHAARHTFFMTVHAFSLQQHRRIPMRPAVRPGHIASIC